MNLYQKGLLAFAAVILIAVITVSLLVGQRTETEFRQYMALYSNRAETLAVTLTGYYALHGTWDGVQAELLQSAGGRGGRGNAQGGGSWWNYSVTDASRNVIADSLGTPGGRLTEAAIAAALPLTVDGDIVGYLVPDRQAHQNTTLDASAEQFLARVRQASFLGGLAAFLAAMLLAGLLTRGIVAPVRHLTQAAQTIAEGDLNARVPIQGRDEIADLAKTFNSMATNLQNAEQARQAQTADIAHELRNPLAVLQGTLEALADGIYDPTPDNIQPALDQVRTLNRLVNDLRTLALADAGQLRLEIQPVALDRLVTRVAEGYRETLAEKSIALDVHAQGPIPLVPADYERLTQVLNNILSNAGRYIPANSTIDINITPENDGVTVRIADDGPGVPAEALPHLFARFWRSEPSRSRATGGSGLGLAIARHVIEAHGGRIWAEPTPGGGLTLGFWLPAGSEARA